MAGILQHLRSSTLDKRPNPGSMVDGQVAVNYASGSPGLFFKDTAGALVKVGPVHVGTTAPNVSPASGGTAGNSRGEQWLDTTGGTYVFKIWDGSAWRSESGTFVDTSGDTMTGALIMPSGTAAAPSIAVGTTTNGLYSPGANQVAITTSGTGRLFVDSSGRVGVGTASPSTIFHIGGSPAAQTIRINSSTSAGFYGVTGDITQVAANRNPVDGSIVNTGTATAYINLEAAVSNGNIQFCTTASNNTGATERARIDSSGSFIVKGAGTAGVTQAVSLNGSAPVDSLVLTSAGQVGIGTSGPEYQLDVATIGRNSTGEVLVTAGNNASNDYTQTTLLRLRATSINPNRGTHNDGASVAEIRLNHADEAGNNSSGSISFYTNPSNFNTAVTERMTINSSGRVGIGTSSPQTLLNISEGAAGASTVFTCGVNGAYDGSQAISLGAYLNTSYGCRIRSIYNYSANLNTALAFETSNAGTVTEAVRIDSSGRLLVGTSSASGGYLNNDSLVHVQAGGANAGITIHRPTTFSALAAPYLFFSRSRGTPAVIVNSGDNLGSIEWGGADGTDVESTAAAIKAEVDGTPGANDMPGRLVFSTTADGASSPTEAMRITQNGYVTGKTTNIGSVSGAGWALASVGFITSTVSSDVCLYVNRTSNDGNLVNFYQDDTIEGSISVSGTTVSYNGAHLSRWSQLPTGAEREEILRGTVLSNIDEMCEWGSEDNEQLNRMKVSDVEGDKNVSGVFQAWDDDDDTYTNDFYCAMTGDFIIRIAGGVTVERGDLLMSAGDGTAKPQDDDIIRSKTIAKVTSTNVSCTYADGSYCVPCVLMAC